jgi:hypothetical protein
VARQKAAGHAGMRSMRQLWWGSCFCPHVLKALRCLPLPRRHREKPWGFVTPYAVYPTNFPHAPVCARFPVKRQYPSIGGTAQNLRPHRLRQRYSSWRCCWRIEGQSAQLNRLFAEGAKRRPCPAAAHIAQAPAPHGG